MPTGGWCGNERRVTDFTKLETILRRADEDETTFAERVQQHVEARRANGWLLQTRQDNGASIALVFTRLPID